VKKICGKNLLKIVGNLLRICVTAWRELVCTIQNYDIWMTLRPIDLIWFDLLCLLGRVVSLLVCEQKP
jgi:hypothetical protein